MPLTDILEDAESWDKWDVAHKGSGKKSAGPPKHVGEMSKAASPYGFKKSSQNYGSDKTVLEGDDNTTIQINHASGQTWFHHTYGGAKLGEGSGTKDLGSYLKTRYRPGK